MADVKINNQFFSGTQASLFIGDTWVDDIVSISYQHHHNRQPVFGYGSQHWDFVPKGIIMIQGEFTINFREPNYLFMILERYKKFNAPSASRAISSEQRKMDLTEKRIQDINQTFPDDPRRNLEHFFAADADSARRVKDVLGNQFYGTPKSTQKTERMNHQNFGITIGYGDLGPNTIGEKINGIQLLGKGKVIQIDGRPIMETYSFIARDNL
jgi:hypothetical protein